MKKRHDLRRNHVQQGRGAPPRLHPRPMAWLLAGVLVVSCQPAGRRGSDGQRLGNEEATAARPLVEGAPVLAASSNAAAGRPTAGGTAIADPALTPKDLEAPAGCELSCATKLTYEERDVVAQPGAKIGDFTRCPVSGVVFVVSGEKPRRQVDGKDVFVCCESCAQRFQLEPAYFMARANGPKGG